MGIIQIFCNLFKKAKHKDETMCRNEKEKYICLTKK